MDKSPVGFAQNVRGRSWLVAAFGAIELLADIETRFRVPVGGGRATDPDLTAPAGAANPEHSGGDDGRCQGAERRERRTDELPALLLEGVEQINEDDMKGYRYRSGVEPVGERIHSDSPEVRRRMTTHRTLGWFRHGLGYVLRCRFLLPRMVSQDRCATSDRCAT